MATPQTQQPKLDRYVILHVATTCDEHGVYVTKDSAEVIELGWIMLDSKSCEEVCNPLLNCLILAATSKLNTHADTAFLQLHRESVLVKPVNTPITPLCSE